MHLNPWVHVFLTFCMTKSVVCLHQLCCLPAKVQWLVWRKAHVLFDLWTQWLLFSWNTRFTYIADKKLWSSRLEYIEKFNQKWMSGEKTWMSLLPEGKQYLLPIQGFKEKLESWKTCICHCNCELDNFLKIFLMRLIVSVWYCIMKCVNFWKIWELSEQYFQITNAWQYKVISR